ncbi:hypothetical protein M407DRAFT_246872, partial [Tulasnella calospora MUT 4182]
MRGCVEKHSRNQFRLAVQYCEHSVSVDFTELSYRSLALATWTVFTLELDGSGTSSTWRLRVKVPLPPTHSAYST